MSQKVLAIFDLDGTITKKDTFIEFLKFYSGSVKTYLSFLMLSPFLILYKLKMFDNQRMKELMLQFHFKGHSSKEVYEKGVLFIQVLDDLCKPEMIQKLQNHLEQNHEILILSASCSHWVKPWADKNNFALICSEMKLVDGKITGTLEGYNCHGEEKLHRLQASYDLSAYNYLYAYGNEKSDLYYMNLANESFMV